MCLLWPAHLVLILLSVGFKKGVGSHKPGKGKKEPHHLWFISLCTNWTPHFLLLSFSLTCLLLSSYHTSVHHEENQPTSIRRGRGMGGKFTVVENEHQLTSLRRGEGHGGWVVHSCREVLRWQARVVVVGQGKMN